MTTDAPQAKKQTSPDRGFVWPWSHWKWNDKNRQMERITATWEQYIVSCILSWLIWMVLALLIYSCCFPSEPEFLSDPEDPMQVFKHQHFGCFKTPRMCCCSLFCPAIQWADTMHLAGFLKVWVGLAVFFACALLNSMMMIGVACVGTCTSCLIILYRQRLREKLGMKSWTCSNCLFDFIFVCCCPCCAIAQEARVVRYAYQGSPYTARASPQQSATISRVAYASQAPPGRRLMPTTVAGAPFTGNAY